MSDNRMVTENGKKDEIEKIDIMNLVADVINALKKLWIILLVIVVVCTLRLYFATTISYTPKYVASATVSVTTPSSSYADVEAASQMAEVFPYVLDNGVLEDVIIKDLGLDSMPGSVSVKAEEGMNMMTISASSGDPQMAYDLLMSVINCYPEVTEYIFGPTSLEILDETGIPSDTQKEVVVRGSYKRGALQGIIISGIILCIYVMSKQTVRSKDKLKKQINIKELGSLPYVRLKKRKKQEFNNLCILNERIPSYYEEALRRLRIQILREMESDDCRVLMITSSVPEEGKTTVSVNVALSLAKQGKRVILVDCDPRNPSIAGVLQREKENRPGIGSMIRGEISVDEAMERVDLGGTELKVLYGGEPNSRDSALFGTAKMKKFIENLERKADYVILDTAPAELLSDALFLSKYIDAAVYVIRYDHTKMKSIRNGIGILGVHGVKILGFVFNGDKSSGNQRYGYGYRRYGSYGHYGHYGHYGKNRGSDKQEDLAGRVIKE